MMEKIISVDGFEEEGVLWVVCELYAGKLFPFLKQLPYPSHGGIEVLYSKKHHR